jgi:hypothetical protein
MSKPCARGTAPHRAEGREEAAAGHAGQHAILELASIYSSAAPFGGCGALVMSHGIHSAQGNIVTAQETSPTRAARGFKLVALSLRVVPLAERRTIPRHRVAARTLGSPPSEDMQSGMSSLAPFSG